MIRAPQTRRKSAMTIAQKNGKWNVENEEAVPHDRQISNSIPVEIPGRHRTCGIERKGGGCLRKISRAITEKNMELHRRPIHRHRNIRIPVTVEIRDRPGTVRYCD